MSRSTNPDDGTADLQPLGPMPLVVALWQRYPPVADDAGGGDAGGGRPAQQLIDLRGVLAAVATAATQAAVDGPPLERNAARLLAETAGVMYDALGTPGAPPSVGPRGTAGPVCGADRRTPWADRLRFARLERWLTARAEADADAEPAASLCLWVLDHLEIATPLLARILPP